MAGHQQGHQLVAQLLLRHRRAVLVARGEQHRQHVVALLGVGLGAALVDQLEQQGVDVVAALQELLEAAAALEEREHRRRVVAQLEVLRQGVPDRVQPRAGVEPEDRAQDHLERERLEAGVERDRLVERPGRYLALGHLLEQAAERRHPLAVERGQHQLALGEVGALVEQDHGVHAYDRLEDARALAGMQHVGRGGEDLLDVRRVGQVDRRRGLEEAEREALAVARAAALEERDAARPPRERLNGARGARTGGQVRHGGADRSARIPRVV